MSAFLGRLGERLSRPAHLVGRVLKGTWSGLSRVLGLV